MSPVKKSKGRGRGERVQETRTKLGPGKRLFSNLSFVLVHISPCKQVVTFMLYNNGSLKSPTVSLLVCISCTFADRNEKLFYSSLMCFLALPLASCCLSKHTLLSISVLNAFCGFLRNCCFQRVTNLGPACRGTRPARGNRKRRAIR
jgi:hypothetical protein